MSAINNYRINPRIGAPIDSAKVQIITGDVVEHSVLEGTLVNSSTDLLPTAVTPTRAECIKLRFWFRASNAGVLSAVLTNISTGVAKTTAWKLLGGAIISATDTLQPGEIPVPAGYKVNFRYTGAGGGSYDLIAVDEG